MSGIQSGGAAKLRAEFAHAFAEAPRAISPTRNFLGIGIAGQSCAIAMEEIAGLFVDRTILALPSRCPACLGVAGIRGEIIAVHSLAAWLGGGLGGPAPRWLALTHCGVAHGEVAFAFDRLEGYFRLPSAAIPASPTGSGHLRGMVESPDGPRGLISLSSIQGAITHFQNSMEH